MSTKSASTPRRRSSPATFSKSKATPKASSKRARKVAARAATPKPQVAASSSRRSTTAAPTTPALSGRAIAAARAKLEKLGSKWKELLPRLKKVAV